MLRFISGIQKYLQVTKQHIQWFHLGCKGCMKFMMRSFTVKSSPASSTWLLIQTSINLHFNSFNMYIYMRMTNLQTIDDKPCKQLFYIVKTITHPTTKLKCHIPFSLFSGKNGINRKIFNPHKFHQNSKNKKVIKIQRITPFYLATYSD